MKVLLIQHCAPRTTFVVPLGLGYLAAILKSKGVSVEIIDVTAPYAQYDNETIVRIVEQKQFDFIGVTMTTLFATFAYELVSILSRQNKLVVCGGPHVSLYPHEPLYHGARISVRGEGEFTISEIVDYLHGEKRLSDILGLSYFDRDGKIIDNPPRPLIENLDNIPFPDKDVFNFDDYVQNENDIDKFGNILSSRGCPSRCTYCSKEVFGRRYRYRSAQNIVNEIKALNKKYGLKHFSFIDDAMTINLQRIDSLCNLFLNQIDFSLTWTCITRVDFLKPELLKKMKQSGCIHINYGIESGNPQTLKRIKKDTSIDRMKSTLLETRKAGIDYSINFMWGYPWETTRDIENSINFMKQLSKEAILIGPAGILMPFPGTELYEEYKKEYGFENWWLDKERFTGLYRTRPRNPLFRYFFYEDHGLLEDNGFFNYPKPIKRKIKKAVRFIGKFNLRKQPFIYYLVGLLFVYLSQIIYKLSPDLEMFIQKVFFFFLRLKRRSKMGRKR